MQLRSGVDRPTVNTSYEPKFLIDVSSEHTPINLPTRNMRFQQVHDATITASEDLDLLQHSGASSSSQHMAASRVPTLLKLGSSGTSHTKMLADYDYVASRTGIKETCVDVDREAVVSSLFQSVLKGREIETKMLWQTSRDWQHLCKINWPGEEKNWPSKDVFEAGADVEVKLWERNSDIALCEIQSKVRVPTIAATTGESMV